MWPVAMNLRQSLAGNERGQHQLGHVLGQRRDGGQNQRGRTAEEYGGGKLLASPLGDGVVVATALPDLPVHAGGACVVYLHAIHSEVVPRFVGMRRVDEWKR